MRDTNKIKVLVDRVEQSVRELEGKRKPFKVPLANAVRDLAYAIDLIRIKLDNAKIL